MKFTGSGNDFLIFIPEHYPKIKPRIKELCDRKWGIGADGILIALPHKNYDFQMVYHNSDGSIAEFCGNGARCLVYYYYLVTGRKKLKFIADDGEHYGEIIYPEGRISVSFSILVDKKIDFYIKDIKEALCFVRVGVPHTVLFRKDLENLSLEKEGKLIRFHPYFSPDGTNVNWVRIMDKNRIELRTYERGVEGETLACGTGIVSAAYITREKFAPNENNFEVRTRGGEVLIVHFDKNFAFLEGNVKRVFKGTVEL